MARTPIVIALLVMAAVGIWRVEPFLTQQREVVVSTPAPPPLYVDSPATLPPHGTGCMSQMPFDPKGQVFQFIVAAPEKNTPALDITLKAPGYDDRVQLPAGYVPGPVQVNVNPPKHSVLGTLCFRNTGKVPVLLRGSSEGRTQSRPNLTVNGAPVGIKITSKFIEAKQASLVSRVPEIVGHAATFKPLPMALVWVFAVLALLGIPALVLMAFATSVRAGTAAVVDPVPTATPVPLPWLGPLARRGATRARDLARSIPAPWAFGVLMVVLAAYLYEHALRAHAFQLDEDAYVYLARFTWEHLPSSLWNTTVMNRGLQRLEPWLLMIPLSLFKGAVAFQIGHALNVIAYVSAGIPAYLIGRAVGLRSAWRLLAVFLTLVVPWAIVATTFLTEPLGYPGFCWGVWAIWRAAAMPRARRDLLAVGIIVLACLARSSMIVLFPLLYLTVFVQVVRFGPHKPREVLALHWPLIGFIGLALVMYVLSKSGVLPQVGALTGYYGTSPQGISAAFLHKNWIYVAKTAVGTGLVPVVVGGAWLVARSVRPRDAVTHALAFAGLGAIVLVLYSNATAGTDERYIIYLAFPLAVATAVAFARREAPWLLVLIAGALTVRLIYHTGWNAEGGPFGYFVGPAETFYARAVLLKISVSHPGTDPRHIAVLFELLIVAACAFAMTRRRPAWKTGIAVVLGLVAVQAVQTQYVMSRYIDQAVAGGPGGPSQKQLSFVDEAIWGKGTAGYWSVDAGNSGLYGGISIDVQFWNSSIRSVIGMNGSANVQVPPGDDLILTTSNPVTGYVTKAPPTPGAAQTAKLPPYIVAPADGRSAVYGKVIAHSATAPLELVKVNQPLRLRWGIAGVEPDGWLTPGPATVRVYAAALTAKAGQCLQVDVRSPFGWKGDWRLTSHGFSQRAAIKSEGLARVDIPLKDIAAGKPYQEVKLEGIGKPVALSDGRKATVQLAAVSTVRCSP